MNSKNIHRQSKSLRSTPETGEAIQKDSLASFINHGLEDVLAAIDQSTLSPLEFLPGFHNGVGNTSGVNAFRSLFVPLPEYYLSQAKSFMDCYVSGQYQQSFTCISLYTWRDDTSGLLSLYLASAALAVYDIPSASIFLDAAFENGSFELGNWWFKSLYQTLLGDFSAANHALLKMLDSPLNTQNRFLEAWGKERKNNAQQALCQA